MERKPIATPRPGLITRLLRVLLGHDPAGIATSQTRTVATWPGPRPGRALLFLDFDGMLHRAENGFFEFVPNLERFLARVPYLDVVISSNWRINVSRDVLLGYFPVSCHDRIVGVTPVLNGRYAREAECLAYASRHGVTRFVAVDTNAQHHFGLDCHWVIPADRDGIGERSSRRIIDLLERASDPSQTRRSLIERAVPGLVEYETASAAWAAATMSEPRDQENRQADGCSAATASKSQMVSETHANLEAVFDRYPEMFYYDTIVGFNESSNEARAAIGRRAMTALAAGADPKFLVFAMQREWDAIAPRDAVCTLAG